MSSKYEITEKRAAYWQVHIRSHFSTNAPVKMMQIIHSACMWVSKNGYCCIPTHKIDECAVCALVYIHYVDSCWCTHVCLDRFVCMCVHVEDRKIHIIIVVVVVVMIMMMMIIIIIIIIILCFMFAILSSPLGGGVWLSSGYRDV